MNMVRTGNSETDIKTVSVALSKDTIDRLTVKCSKPQTLDELAREIISKTCVEIAKDRSLFDIFPYYVDVKRSKTEKLNLNFTKAEYEQVIGTAAYATAYEILCEKDGLHELICRILYGYCAETANSSKDEPKDTKHIEKNETKPKEKSYTMGIYGSSTLHSAQIKLEQEKIQSNGSDTLIILQDGYYSDAIIKEMFESCIAPAKKTKKDEEEEQIFRYIDLFTNKTITKRKTNDGKLETIQTLARPDTTPLVLTKIVFSLLLLATHKLENHATTSRIVYLRRTHSLDDRVQSRHATLPNILYLRQTRAI